MSEEHRGPGRPPSSKYREMMQQYGLTKRQLHGIGLERFRAMPEHVRLIFVGEIKRHEGRERR